jgi:AraC-like DNA-binding protein
MEGKSPREQIKMWHLPKLGNIELLHACYITQTFSRHSHDCYAVGVIESGSLGFYYRGESLIASSGTIDMAVPGEAHTGHAASDSGWKYRMFYLESGLLEQAVSEVAGRPKGLPFFRQGVIQDARLAKQIHHLHTMLEEPQILLLEQESLLLWTLTQLVLRHADDRPVLRSIGHEQQSVKRVREFIEAFYDQNISINQLSHISNLSPFHLVRVFRRKLGIPPHAYLIQTRVMRTKSLLDQSWPIAHVAIETGFVDQSHLTRHFKRILGITPGQYSKIVQDN